VQVATPAKVRRDVTVVLCALVAICAACSSSSRSNNAGITPTYDKTSGRLTELAFDSNHNGKVDTWTEMNGPRPLRSRIDRNEDGRIDRWEYYVPVPPGASAAASPDGRNMIDHADEASGPDDRVTRKELYQNGVIQRVEEDTDADGRIDKWEAYREGQLTQVSLDLQGKGFADRRLTYGPDGSVRRVEADPDGDGAFTPVVAESSSARAGGSGR